MNTRCNWGLQTSSALLLSVIAACAGGKVTEVPVTGSSLAPVPGADGAANQEAGFFLTVDGPAAVEVKPNTSLTVQVQLFKFGGDIVEGGEVNFWLEDAPDTVRLLARTARTDELGFARVELNVGASEGAFRFGANAHLADDVFVAVKVTADPEPEPEVVVPQIPDVAGTYDVESTYDLTTQLGDGGERIRQIGRVFENPGRFLAEFISVDGFVGALFRGVAEGVINDLLIANSPDWLQSSLTIGDDILKLLTKFRVRSELMVFGDTVQPGIEPNPDGKSAAEVAGSLPSWEGTHTWKAVRYEWEQGCPPGVEGCGDSEVLLPADATAHALRGTATMDGAITIHDHPMDVPVGDITLRLVTQVVLPATTGHAGFAGMLGEIVDCNAFGAAGEEAVGVPFTSGLISAGCRKGLEKAAEALESQVADALRMELGSLAGVARAMDDDRDGRYDKWGAGVWTGVDGRFTAIRR